MKRALEAVGNRLKESSFDGQGNFAFGVKEHIEVPGTKYVPELGIIGFDVIATMERPGFRVKRRRIRQSKVGKTHLVTKEEAIRFVRSNFGTEIVGGPQ
jgi:large subunit ribosomal protein L5